MMTRHLLWKDGMTIKPLVSAILIGIVAIYVVLMLATVALGETDSADLYVSFWILMPNLVALGAPALLIGGEEENGTLSWLRSLPVSWKKIADSKFLVGLGALVIAWIASSLLMLASVYMLSTGLDPILEGRASISSGTSSFVEDVLRPSGILYLLFFSVLLLLCGFSTAYLFRSPIAGLIAVIPLIALVNQLAVDVGRFMLTGHFQDVGRVALTGNANFAGVIFAGAALLMTAWVVQRLLACRRLTYPYTNRIKNLQPEEAVSAYRPPLSVGTLEHPSQSKALLWQQVRQMALPALALTLIVSIFVDLVYVDSSNGRVSFLRDIAPLVIAIGASWLGGLAFYGDNVRRRRAFFADRGISATQIWWTRMLFPVGCYLLISVVCVIAQSQAPHRPAGGFLVLLTVTFFFGHLIGQWMQRPVLTFFMAPAYAAGAALVLFLYFDIYPNYLWTTLLIAPVLLFATWHLSDRWLTERVNRGYHWRTIAYSALAITVPLMAIIASRVWTTPKAMPDWRARTLAIELPKFLAHPNGRLMSRQEIMPDTFSYSGSGPTFERGTTAEQRDLFAKELAAERIGEYVSIDDIGYVIGIDEPGIFRWRARHATPELQRDAVAVLLKWSRQVREGVLKGQATLADLDRVSEDAESKAVAMLTWLVSAYGPTPELQELVDAIPSQQLRHDSRRVALLAQWQSFQRQSWRTEYPNSVEYGKYFTYAIAWGVARFPWEQTRAERYIDEFAKMMLDQLDNGLPKSVSSPGFVKCGELWTESLAPTPAGAYQVDRPCRNWTQEYEDSIEKLRANF